MELAQRLPERLPGKAPRSLSPTTAPDPSAQKQSYKNCVRGLSSGPLLYEAMHQQSAVPLVNEIVSQGSVAASHEADLSNVSNIPLLFDRCEAELGPVDVLVNNHTCCVLETFDPDLVTEEGFSVHLPTATASMRTSPSTVAPLP